MGSCTFQKTHYFCAFKNLNDMKFKSLVVLMLLSVLGMQAQSFAPLETSNYAGVKGLIFNPSNVVDSRFKSDINLVGASASVSNDYFGIDLGSLLEDPGSFDFDEDASRDASNSNNFNVELDVLGPGFMFNLTPKSSIGVVTRVRGALSANNISGNLFESIAEEFDILEDYSFDVNNLNATTHAWGELGVTYGRILIDKETSFLKGGVTLKALFGSGVVYTNSNDLSGSYSVTNESISTQGSITYGSTFDENDEDFTFDDLTTGFGMDLGFTYEWRPERTTNADDRAAKSLNKYRLKIGVAVTDIGSITYDGVEETTYDLNRTVNTDNFEDLQDFLEGNYQGTDRTVSAEVKLPTAFRIYADYSFTRHLYVGFSGVFSARGKDDAFTNRVTTGYRIIPRYESRLFGVQSPLGFDENGTLNWGAGFRLGPVVVGSNSLISNVLNSESQAADVYVGVNIPILHKKK